ncbi:uncharacterized protein LOC115633106 isoform X2 [Scaptodrosophila lebanonensis]|uniref:Uncharacterized protein LOC115633106 isoform X2 n=1 Tax=Drosophila lebanonensis TaxID=7225 RepID=A0A6J2UDX2_DROLE|nr:uncharacterized protein LOC115633106 isoform X2 [Scaptodrosophila lebanonensis]
MSYILQMVYCDLINSSSTEQLNSATTTTTSTSTSTSATSNDNNVVITTIPSPIVLPVRQDCATQYENMDIFSDEHFLEIVRPQMAEMNARQKLKFKQKILQSLMETFDDATDFPNAGEVQHFNINTPSNFEHVTDPELRLVRELAALVSAAKFSAGLSHSPPASVQLRSRTGEEISVPRHILQRICKQPGTAAVTAIAESQDKRFYRILQMPGPKAGGAANGNGASGAATSPGAPVIGQRSANAAEGASPAAGGGTAFAVPAARITTVSKAQDTNVVGNVTGSPLSALFGNNPNANAINKNSTTPTGTPIAGGSAATSANTIRQMNRRYSICGTGGPVHARVLHKPSPGILNEFDNASLLKRRMMSPGQAAVPQQRPRYSNTASANPTNGVAGQNPLVRANSKQSIGTNNRQPSPSSIKTPQIASVASGEQVFTKPQARTIEISPQKRPNLVVANPKGGTTVTARPNNSKSLASRAQTLNQLLGEIRKTVPQKTSNTMSGVCGKQQETAATIAADNFSLASLKREPQDIDDNDDILGM